MLMWPLPSTRSMLGVLSGRNRTRGDGSPARRLVAGLALLTAGLLPLAGAQAATQVVPSGTGLTLPASVAVTPDGGIWISDEETGICRVELEPEPRLVEDGTWCGPAEGVVNGVEVALRDGPTVPHQMAFRALDTPTGPSTTEGHFFVTDGSSKGSGVWRLKWEQSTTPGEPGRVVSGEQIVSRGGDRNFGLAVSPEGHVDFTGRDDTLVRRVPNAATAPAGTTPIVVGVAGNPEVPSLAYHGGALYLAEPTGVTRIAAPGPGAPVAEPVPGFPGGVPNALASDPVNDRLYAGTNNGNGVDQIDVLNPDGSVATYEPGFALVTGLGVGPDGMLYVADDPATASGSTTAVGLSRLWTVPFVPDTDRPAVTITSGPPNVGSATTATFAYSSREGTSFSCRFDGAPFGPCGIGPSDTRTFAGLADGLHTFEIFAVETANPSNVGRTLRRTFRVDTRPPVVTVDNGDRDRTTTQGQRVQIDFSSDELHTRFECSLDGAPATPCTSPRSYSGLAVGDHTLTVTGTDLAGNSAASEPWTFTVRPAPAPPAPPAPEQPEDARPPRVQPAPGPEVAPIFRASSEPERCVGLAVPRQPGSFRLTDRGRLLEARLLVPRGARYVKLTFRDARSGKRRSSRGRGAKRLRTRKLAVRYVFSSRPTQTLRIRLSRNEARRARSDRYIVAVAYGSCATTVGPWNAIGEGRTPSRRRSRR